MTHDPFVYYSNYISMSSILIEDKLFEKLDFTSTLLAKGEYDHCRFVHCNFSNGDLSHIQFSECEFYDCNLSTASLVQTAFKDITFKDCKLQGLHFENCNDFLFEVVFDNCILNLSSFYKLKLKKTIFKNSSLQEVDFSESNLGQASFDNCDLALAIFDNTMLEKADLRTAYNYSIDPQHNYLKKAKFSITGIKGLLDKHDIEIE